MFWITLLVIVIVAYVVYHRRSTEKARSEIESRNVPYYQPRHIILSFLLGERIEDVVKAALNKMGKIYGSYSLGTYNIMVAEPELLQLVLSKEFTNFTNRRDVSSFGKPFSNALSAVNGEQWKRLRAIITPTFAAGKIKRMKPCADEVSKTLVSNFEKAMTEGDAVNIKRYAGAYTMDVITQVAFGIKVDSIADPDNPILLNVRQLFGKDMSIKNIIQMGLVLGLPRIAKLFGVGIFNQAIDFFEDLSYKIIEEKRKMFRQKENIGKATNFIELLLEAELEGEVENGVKNGEQNGKIHKYISNEEIMAQCVIFFLAGFDTTATTITLTCYYLATNPDKQEKLYEEITTMMAKLAKENPEADPYELITFEALSKFEYLGAVVNETLRLSPPATMTERRAGSDIKLETSDGKIRIDLRKDDIIQIPIYNIHYNEEYFSEPEQYQPERFLGEPSFPKYAYLPFGSGPRNCVARSLALFEARLAVLHLIRCYKLSTCASTKVPVEFYYQGNFLAPKDVLLRVDKRH